MQYSLNELEKAARFLIKEASSEKIWCFVGEMGAGKTTLIKEICRQFEVVDTLSSPTFSIVNAYQNQSGEEFFHFDFYRVEDDREIIQLGVEEYFDSGKHCFIEWPDRVIDFLPDRYLKISVKLVADNLRELTTTHV